jgi:hypothetical protein
MKRQLAGIEKQWPVVGDQWPATKILVLLATGHRQSLTIGHWNL